MLKERLRALDAGGDWGRKSCAYAMPGCQSIREEDRFDPGKRRGSWLKEKLDEPIEEALKGARECGNCVSRTTAYYRGEGVAAGLEGESPQLRTHWMLILKIVNKYIWGDPWIYQKEERVGTGKGPPVGKLVELH